MAKFEIHDDADTMILLSAVRFFEQIAPFFGHVCEKAPEETHMLIDQRLQALKMYLGDCISEAAQEHINNDDPFPTEYHNLLHALEQIEINAVSTGSTMEQLMTGIIARMQ